MTKASLDFRSFSPACVIAIDLVKHSQHSKEEINLIQQAMEAVLRESTQPFSPKDCLFNHTGDGYLCVLLGDASARAMDFVNSCFPSLSGVLQQYHQEFRAGVDFGIVHIRQNTIAGTRTVFDFSTIQASRLESVAPPGAILCTTTVKNIFGYYYQDMFTSSFRIVSAKDREIECYEITPMNLIGVREVFSNYLFRTQNIGNFITNIVGERKRILIVDDELPVLDSIRMILKPIGKDNVVTASSGREALEVFEPGKFLAVVTDLKMPGMGGYEVTSSLIKRDPGIAVVMVTGYGSDSSARRFIGLGGVVYISKPFEVGGLLQALGLAIQIGGTSGILNNLRLICDDPIGLMLSLEEISTELNYILRLVPDAKDPVHGLLRHKARHIGMDIIPHLTPGGDVVRFIKVGLLQLSCIKRLARAIVTETLGPEEHLNILISDLEKENPNLQIEFRCSLEGLPREKRLFTAATMVLCELLDNSITALKERGKIQADLYYERSRRVLRIRVRDDGRGVDPAIESILFQEGVTTRGEGRGLGLALVRRTCELFHGEVTYVFDNGAVMTATLFPSPPK